VSLPQADFLTAYLGSTSNRGSPSSDDADEFAAPAANTVISDVNRRLDMPAIAKSEFVAAVLYFCGLLEHDDGRDVVHRISVLDSNSRPGDPPSAAAASAGLTAGRGVPSKPLDCTSYFCPSSFASKDPPSGLHGSEITGAVPQALLAELLICPAHLSRGQQPPPHREAAVRPMANNRSPSPLGGHAVGVSLVVGATYHAEWVLKRKV
jgi:hypothetical protein